MLFIAQGELYRRDLIFLNVTNLPLPQLYNDIPTLFGSYKLELSIG